MVIKHFVLPVNFRRQSVLRLWRAYNIDIWLDFISTCINWRCNFTRAWWSTFKSDISWKRGVCNRIKPVYTMNRKNQKSTFPTTASNYCFKKNKEKEHMCLFFWMANNLFTIPMCYPPPSFKMWRMFFQSMQLTVCHLF